MEQVRYGKYELLARLGQGGMGEVWKARDTQLQRYVAVKLLNADFQDKANFVAHFMHEAQLVASLHHPNIVQIHDFQLIDEPDSRAKAYMVMDYIEGGTLADYIRNTTRKGLFPPAADIVYLFTTIGLALDYAHQRGMIHRDIKPENILLDKSIPTTRSLGEPILSDFGIARVEGAGSSTVTNAWIGTPHYMSPEQAQNRPVDARSDLYSLGIVLYEVLTGVTPFRGEGAIAIIMKHLLDTPTPPNLINPRISPALSEVVLRSIAKDPAARFPSASAMTIALAQALNVPVPASLDQTRRIPEQTNYNPLQPSSSLSGPQLQSPAMAGYAGPQAISLAPPPAHPAPATGDYVKATRETPPPQKQPRPRRKKISIALIASSILLLVAIGAVVVARLIPTTTSGTPDTVVGTLVFSSSSNPSHVPYNQIQLDLKNITDPPQNMVYYGWIENADPDIPYPHWQLTFSHGAIQGTFASSPPTNLLANTTTFLITVENASSASSLITPTLDLTRHRYYAALSSSSASTPTFQVRQCPPPTSTGNPGNQWCR
jgi:serine/threonine-protein kinase